MKRILFFLAIAVAISVSAVRAQDTIVHCPIPCGNESFPYIFCTVTGYQIAQCSTNPNDMSGLVAAKSKMPGCVTVIPPDTGVDFQPSGDAPPFTETPPDRQTIFDDYESSSYGPPPWMELYDPDSDYWSDDSLAYAVGWAQWNLDSGTFLAGDTQEHTYFDNLDFNQQSAYLNYTEHDYQKLWEVYNAEESTYETDSTNYANGLDQPYDQVWNSGSASSDAHSDLNAWLAICHLTGDSTCCILVKPDTNVNHFPGNYQMSASGKLGYPVAFTYGTPGCPDGGACPNSSYRYITYNATNNFFYQNNADAFQPVPSYQLHPSPLMGWYTGPGPDANAANQGYYDFSFQEVIEHEIGHWLGLLHPDSIIRGDTCANNYNYCKDSIPGYWMLMGSKQAQSNIPPRGLGADDSCMFAKLYCPTVSDTTLGVSTPQTPDWFNPEVYPNPSTGGMTLTFGVEERSFTQIDIYDILGNALKEVFIGYTETNQSISLGTETLPSGNYVCRVRVGDQVSYINLAITK